jgi:hypothetical protein
MAAHVDHEVHENHDAHAGHGAHMATTMRNLFFVAAVLTLIETIYSPLGTRLLNLTPATLFGIRNKIFLFLLTAPVVFWGGWPFLSVAGRAGAGHTHSCYRGHGHEISGLALHLLQVSLVYVNTLLIQQILGQSDWQNRLEIEDLRALSPLIYAHVNPYGRFELNMETRFQID